MVITLDIPSYLGWLLNGTDGNGALLMFGITFGSIALLALIGGFLVQLIRYGPMKAGDLTYRSMAGGVRDLFGVSPRRVLALAYLAVKEALRRRAPIALGVFAIILVFAGWFLQVDYQDPAKLQISFVMFWTTILVLVMALLLSTFSLPTDFKNRTIYTILTKPVRPVDVVLGRIVGFGFVTTVILVVMSLAGYVFVNRTLEHQHVVEIDSLEKLATADGVTIGQEGRTEEQASHRHVVQVDENGTGVALVSNGHVHSVSKNEGVGLSTGGVEQAMRSRVPKLGRLSFLGRNGQEEQRGVSVGKEWTYRSNIEGGTLAAAVWRFSNFSEADLRESADGSGLELPVELIVRVFRTHKGNVERGIQGTIRLQNPETGLKSDVLVFSAKDFQINEFAFPMEQYDTDQNPISLTDLVSPTGEIEVVVQALDRAQYFGFAQADCYIRKPDSSPAWNYAKGCLSIWGQMIIVITIGVTASTFLNGPIATMMTSSMILLGFFRPFFVAVATNDTDGGAWGGGPVESAVRMVTHMNVMTPFDESGPVTLMKSVDGAFQTMMLGVAQLLPDFSSLSTADYVARGFSVPGPLVGRTLSIALAYVVGLTVASLFLLRSREVAKD